MVLCHVTLLQLLENLEIQELVKPLSSVGNNPKVTQIMWGRCGLMVTALESGASAPGSSPGRGHCVVFLGKTLHSHSASLHPGV